MAQAVKVGDVIRGDHRVLAIRKGEISLLYICRQNLPGGHRAYKALKTFRLESDEVCRQLFDRELVYWARLPPHPNLVHVKDVDTVNNILVLDFVRGPSLREVATKRPIHPRHFLEWARQITAGMRFLHVEHNFLHRDLRPANILIDTAAGLTAKITDLGIGKPFDARSASHTVIGTFNYMAPEVFQGRTDFRSDMFSLGATLYYLLTGHYVVKLSTENLIQVASPSQRVPGIPQAVSDCVLRCLQKAPEDRYPSIDELIADLNRLEEWAADEAAYENCSRHDYMYFTRRPGTGCPFCAYEKEFQKQELELERVLRA